MCLFYLQAYCGETCIGAIVCKLDLHKKMARRGYIAMLAVDNSYRRHQIGKGNQWINAISGTWLIIIDSFKLFWNLIVQIINVCLCFRK